jgi:hypothetical protein
MRRAAAPKCEEKMYFEVKRAQSSMKSKFVGEEKSLIYLSRQKPGEGKEGIPLFYTNVRKLRFFCFDWSAQEKNKRNFGFR